MGANNEGPPVGGEFAWWWERCPQCKGTNIEGSSVDIDGIEARQECSCLDCDAIWIAIYKASYRVQLETATKGTDNGT